MSWHVDLEVLHSYQAGMVDRVTAVSLEAHVTDCVDCRAAVATDDDWLERSWGAIAEWVEPGPRTLTEKVLVWAGVPSHLARVIAVTPSLRPSWLLAVTLSLAFAAIASRLASQPGSLDLFLMLAPLVPVAGVAVAYGRLGDPAHEITIASPMDPLHLMLIRTASVTGSALVSSLILDGVVPSTRGTGLWILPALALTLATLALGTRLSMWIASAVSAGMWVMLVGVFLVRSDERLAAVFQTEGQLTFGLVAAAAALLLFLGRDEYRRGEGTR